MVTLVLPKLNRKLKEVQDKLDALIADKEAKVEHVHEKALIRPKRRKH